jgi:3-phenylpropionate/trans-cinnamate dioxygenase ferredoxin reductase subunit
MNSDPKSPTISLPGEDRHVVIVGAGQAGVSVAEKLRANGFQGGVTLVGDEPQAPYQRPPLSKAYLLGALERDRLKLKPEDWYRNNRIELRTGVGVDSIDRDGKQVLFADGSALGYDHLVLATGAKARSLPDAIGGGLEGVFTIRSLGDIDRLRPAFEHGKKLLVVGGGYIGLEIAAVARGLGVAVEVVEAADRLIARVACNETAREVEQLHRSKGVTFHFGKALDRLIGERRVEGARLADGTVIDADVVVVGIGATPVTDLAEQTGLEIGNGIAVDAHGRTSDPYVWAAGDCANFALPAGGLRMESVGNAIDSGDLVARNILGAGQAYEPKPWFWSDQFDLKLQIAGQSRPGDDIVVRQGSSAGRSHWYFRDGRLVAVDSMNAPRDYLIGKRLLAASLNPDPRNLSDPEIALESFLT